MPVTTEQLHNWFTYHDMRSKPEAVEDMRIVREAAESFAAAIVACTPPSADQTAAIRKVREAMMTANAAIACGGQ